MPQLHLKFVGVELYFDDLPKAKQFYQTMLGLEVADEQAGHHAKFDSDNGFFCLECKGAESYPSRDKAVLFFEVANLGTAVAVIGRERFVHVEAGWAVMHDPEGHNVLLLQSES